MPQDRESGDRARRWGHFMARRVAEEIGATLIKPGRSNEALWRDRKVLIKSANYGVPQIGATPATIDRVEAIITALQDSDNDFTLYEISSSWFISKMNPSRSPRASHVMMVKCVDVRNIGKLLKRMVAPQWNERQ